MGELYDLGVRVFTDDGDCVADGRVMRARVRVPARACRARCSRSTPKIPRSCAAVTCTKGAWSARLGIPGRPAEAESSIVARDLALARLTGGRYHVLHVSSAAAVELVRAAKADGVRVTAECTPQHLVLTDAACADFDPVFKMNPPLARASRRRRAAAPACATARSTRSRPITRRTRPRPRTCRSRTRRPGCSASRPRSRSC